MEVLELDWLAHHGTPQEYDFDPHGSGRYRQGSGDNPYQHAKEFKDRVAAIKRSYKEENGKYITDKELSGYLFGFNDDGTLKVSIRDFRKMNTRTNAIVDAQDYLTAHKMREHGDSVKVIAEKLSRSQSNIRDLLKRDADAKLGRINNTADLLREAIETKGGYVDIGSGSELIAGVGRSAFEAAVKKLEEEGYVIQQTSIQQLFGQGNTTIKALCPPGTTRADLYRNADKLITPVELRMDTDGNKIPLRPVEYVDSSRIAVRYNEEGGIDKDGVIEIRRGVPDLDMGASTYAQVRIGVDGTHYLKGMAVYSDDLPDGVDILFNSNKSLGTPKMDNFKKIKHPEIPENPFGASISRQSGALNIVNEEGDWSKWSKTLAAQFLAKQYDSTAKRQLKATAEIANAEFEDIKALTNPTLKRYLLEEFADSCEADAVHLKAVRLPGQSQKVLLPLPDNKPTECYCPSLESGTQVALVRYPHGGVFEIPVLTVNNNNPAAEKIMKNAKDAIGIHPSQAGVLSGADFDGDTVMVLPLTGAFKLKAYQKGFEKLKDFEPKVVFKGDHLPEKDLMKKSQTQRQMGIVTNLIMDMTLQGATPEELCRADMHSMVIIDAEKHKLDWKASEKYFRIAELKKKYQTGGASTLITRAKSPYMINERREKAPSKLTPEERERWEQGEKIYVETGRVGFKGTPIQTKTKRMYETADAYDLSSGTTMESYYADYANAMKNLAKKARAELRATGKLEYSSSAYETYKDDVKRLRQKLNTALMNAPLERKAQALANNTWSIERAEHPEYTKEEQKKAKSRALSAARAAVGSGKKHIDITDREWEAIQAGAIHDSTLLKILANTKTDDLRARAMPRGSSISPAKLAKAKAMRRGDYTWADIAAVLGVPVSTLQSALD